MKQPANLILELVPTKHEIPNLEIRFYKGFVLQSFFNIHRTDTKFLLLSNHFIAQTKDFMDEI